MKIPCLKLALFIVLACVVMPGAPKPAVQERVEFAETGELGISLPAARTARLHTLPAEIAVADYSLEYARRTLVPAMGGSMTVGDFDGDGQQDLYVVVPGGSNHLFRNNGNHRFSDVTGIANVAGSGADLSASFADYDRSGRPSLFVAGLGGITLYRNIGGGKFRDETAKAGLKGSAGELSTHAALSDIDNDGFPDLLVTIYTDLSSPPSKSPFVFPNDFPGASSYLYHNNGDGTFTNVTASTDLRWNRGRARNALFADLNNDGHPDLILFREERAPAVYLNDGTGAFREWTSNAGEQLSRNAFFDAAVADFSHDGKLDLALWSTMSSRVLRNNGDARFKLEESLPAMGPTVSPFGFHGLVADLNQDGFDDLLTMNNNGWRFFANRIRYFEEAVFSVSGPTNVEKFDAVTAIHLGNDFFYLLALRPNGQIVVLKRAGSVPRGLRREN